MQRGRKRRRRANEGPRRRPRQKTTFAEEGTEQQHKGRRGEKGAEAEADRVKAVDEKG